MSNTTAPLKVLDLFSGIGGFSLGLERTGGFETVAFCEIEPYPRKVLAKHWSDVPIYEDVRKLNGEEIKSKHGRIDVITGGFPCQDLSVAGYQRGIDADRSGLWSEIARLVGELRPGFVIVENVANLLSGPSKQPGKWFGRVLGDLAALGYDAEWHCIRASDIGAPHIRDRVWIIANPREISRTQSILSSKHVEEGKRIGQKIWRQNRKFSQVDPVLHEVSASGLDRSKIDRMDDGIYSWPHRLAACGNAVIPQIPEIIGHAILEAEGLK